RREVDISPLLTSRCTRSCGRRAGGVRFPGSSAHTDPGRSGSMAIRTWLVGIGGAGFLAASTSFPASAQEPVAWEADLEFHTFSIVAIDPRTGESGVAVTTRRPCVGNAVPWVRPGVGAVATQGGTRLEYGNDLLDLLEQGVAPQD